VPLLMVLVQVLELVVVHVLVLVLVLVGLLLLVQELIELGYCGCLMNENFHEAF
jgi:hypothetical protein